LRSGYGSGSAKSKLIKGWHGREGLVFMLSSGLRLC
jgi:hypothetical protein